MTHRRPQSLTVRLVAGVVVAQLLLAAGLVWAGIVFTRRQLLRAFDSGLESQVKSVAALVRYAEVGNGLVFDPTLLPLARDPRHPPLYRVVSTGAALAGTFPSSIVLPRPGRAARYFGFDLGGVHYRGLELTQLPVLDAEEGRTGPPTRLTVYYAAPQTDIAGEVARAGLAIGLVSLALLAATSLLAVWAVRRGLDPVRELAEQAAAISPQQWRFEPGLASRRTRELQPLAEALERMLMRLEAAHRQQHDFMADTAHHLKTPVAILKSTLQSLLQRPREPAAYAAAAEASLQDVERLEQLLQRMLRLARLDCQPGAALPLPEVALGATCQAAVERVEALAQARGVRLETHGLDAAFRLRADADDLEQAWVNLLENAVQHSPAGSTVELRCAAAPGGRAQVTVRDQGSGIAPDDLPHLFERFRRGAAAEADPRGPARFGLGLAIVRAIIESYGGTVQALSQPPPGATLLAMLPATHSAASAAWSPFS
ncbi:MAG: HAMP domain-containing sensor histidine kinase [Terriglobales bacterium]